MILPKISLHLRRIHMYLALFLTPWLLMYALSSLVFNHFQMIRQHYGGRLNQFEKEKEMEYRAAFPNDATPELIGERILRDLDLTGAFFVRGKVQEGKLIITRQAPFTMRRITYHIKEEKLLIEKQVFQTPGFLTRLHIRHGYRQSYAASWAWGAVVELTAIAMVFWVASGIWLWWEIKPARKLGALFTFIGLALFGLLLATI